MNKEEILNKYIDLIDKGYCCACNELNCIDNFPHAKITHAIKQLQQENEKLKEDLEVYDRIFDVFSHRKYAHRYLEERRKEIPNLLCPDSDEIYQKYYELKERIDKSIEYLKDNSMCPDDIEVWGQVETDIYKILKGESNE